MATLVTNLSSSVRHFLTATLNAGGAKPRRTILNGREYLIAPLVSIVPGVLAGSKGPLLYPAEECARNARDWDGTPIVIYHPSDPLTNRPMSAGEDITLHVGFLKDSRFDGRLRHAAWFDTEKLRAMSADTLNRLERGQLVEVSTGLYTENDKAPFGAAYRGKPYDWVARQYKPDHLAVLPDQIGACSLRDGCGLMVNEAQSKDRRRVTANVWTEAAWQASAEARRATAKAGVASRGGTGSGQGAGISRKAELAAGDAARHAQGSSGDDARAARGFHERAAAAHERAFKAHSAAALDTRSPEVFREAHQRAADAHGDAMLAHSRAARQYTAPRVSNRLTDVVGNWCNQYGGTTCKEGSAGARANAERAAREMAGVKAPVDKIAAVKAAIKETTAKLADLKQTLASLTSEQAASVKAKVKESVSKKADSGPTKGDVAAKAAAGKLREISDRLAAAAGENYGKAQSHFKKTGQWDAKFSGKGTDTATAKAEVRAALGKSSPHKVARELGIQQNFKTSEAAARHLEHHVIARAGAIERSMA